MRAGRPPKACLLYPASADPADAIDHYCTAMAEALVAKGWQVERANRRSPRDDEVDLLLVQYNPFAYGRWGFAPSLAADMAGLRLLPNRPVIAVTVHEPFVPITDLRSLAMSGWQRLQLRAISAAADVVFHPMEYWVDRLGERRPKRVVTYLGVGANVPDGRAGRHATRTRHGWDDQTLVVATLGGSHSSKHHGWVAPTLAALFAAGHRVVHADLGVDPMVQGVEGVARHAPGFLDPAALAAHMAAADIFLAPYVDGVSGRRGSLMAALRNEVAVVSTAGGRSDRALAGPDSGVTVVGSTDLPAFVRAACTLAADELLRQTLAKRAAAVYADHYDWPVLADRVEQASRTPPNQRRYARRSRASR